MPSYAEYIRGRGDPQSLFRHLVRFLLVEIVKRLNSATSRTDPFSPHMFSKTLLPAVSVLP
jgi:hypothetical protein